MIELYITCWISYLILAFLYARANLVIGRDSELVYKISINMAENGISSPSELGLNISMILSLILFQQWPLYITPWFVFNWPIALGFTIIPIIYSFCWGFIEIGMKRINLLWIIYMWLFANIIFVWVSFLIGFSLLGITYLIVV